MSRRSLFRRVMHGLGEAVAQQSRFYSGSNHTSLFGVSGFLAIAGIVCIGVGVSMLDGSNIRISAHLADNYPAYSRDGTTARYACDGSPQQIADELAAAVEPEARAKDRRVEYLRYRNPASSGRGGNDYYVVSVSPYTSRPCSIQIDTVDYEDGSYAFLGPGFGPGAPASGAGGPGGTK